jgi:Lysyl oxidase
MVPVIPADKNSPQKANQQFLDANGNVVATCSTASESVYHPAHKHFHISGVASFEVHSKSAGGPLKGESLGKVTSCLIDWVRLDGNSPDNERGYSSCDSGVQGISPGWVDQYHKALEGQSIDITGMPVGTYYLVSKANLVIRLTLMVSSLKRSLIISMMSAKRSLVTVLFQLTIDVCQIYLLIITLLCTTILPDKRIIFSFTAGLTYEFINHGRIDKLKN